MAQPSHIAIVGANGGIGAALLDSLLQREGVQKIYATYRQEPPETSTEMVSACGTVEVSWSKLDASQEDSVASWLANIDQLDWVINCVGMLHTEHQGPEKSMGQIQPDHFLESMSINCLPTLLIAKYAHQVLKRSPQALFATISARVGSITDNRLGGWYSYRASKAALNMSLKCLSIEWGRSAKNINVVALHPGTTDTRLSQPFQKNVPANKLFSANKTAGLLLDQLYQAHQQPSGRFIAYDGSEIPW